MSKKVIGALLAIVMVLSVFSFSVFAVGTGYDNNPDHIQTWGLANKTGSDGTYTVDVLLTTTYEVGPIQFKIDGVDEVTKVTVGSGYYAAVANAGKSGLISLIPDTSTLVPVKKLSNAVVATVTYKSASNGTPSIKDDVKSASNPQGTLMASFADGNGYLNGSNFLVGQEATIVPLGGEMPDVSVDAAELQTSVSGVVIDTTKTFGGAYAGAVYGALASSNGEAEITSADYYTSKFTATNGGSVTAVKSIYSGRKAVWGTGTVLEVYNADGTLAGKYIVIIFGDVDGNSKIENADVSLVLAEFMSPSLPDIKKMACNVYYPGRGSEAVLTEHLYKVDNNDLGLVLQQAMQYNALDFAAIGTKHSQYNNYQ